MEIVRGRRIRNLFGVLSGLKAPVMAGLVLLLAWIIASRIEPSYVFPSITSVVSAVWSFIHLGTLWPATLSTTRSVLLGSVTSFFVGLVYGFLMHRFPSFFGPILNFIQTIPPIVYALMAVVWFGINFTSVIFVVFIVGFPIVAVNTAEGLANTDPLLQEMSQACQASRVLIVREVILPGLVPYLLSAARIMLSFSWRFAILGEMFAGGSGVGYNLNYAYEQSMIPQLFGWTVWLVILMWISDYGIMLPLERRLTKWKHSG